eukprot:Gregarina_sp_Poly_1__3177@NODE_18_length_21885_cov_39_980383_g16_i0_p5_GENE_NODE_18_length_21885_cov_39_980383_g16_i0NODE_18_length_21885_cov_39_980383_g16_i0_p5_ORF_typecomplete_len312_score54_66NPL/PF17800_1/0_0029TFIIF_alpha/PF05793_12/0_012_NODE_18_length_21885_cov_39_980383_g16_i01785418789
MAFAGYHLSSKSKTSIENALCELTHASRVCLTEYKTPCNYQVRLEDETGKSFCIGLLTDQSPQILLEHYIPSGCKIWLEGKGEASADLTGYIEPAYPFSGDEDERLGDEEDESEDEEEHVGSEEEHVGSEEEHVGSEEEHVGSEEEVELSEVEEIKSDSSQHDNSTEDFDVEAAADDDDDDDDNEENEASSPTPDVEEEPELESEDNEPSVYVKEKSSKARVSSSATRVSGERKKRKGENLSEPPAKRQVGPEADYERSLIEELKRIGGRTKISLLGAKVSRPAGVPKLSVFLKQHPSSFVCDGHNVALVE